MSSNQVPLIFMERVVEDSHNSDSVGITTGDSNDEPNIHLDQDFDSCEDAFNAYKMYARHHGFSVRIQRVYRKRGEQKDLIRKDFVCYKGNNPRKKRCRSDIQTELRSRSSCKCDCKARMAVTAVNRGDRMKWHVVLFTDTHNHALLTQNEVRHLRAHRFISQHCRDRILALDSCGIPTRQILSIIAEEQQVLMTDLPFNTKDVHNFLGAVKKSRRQEDAGKILVACLELQRTDPDFKFDYEVDSDNRLKHIAWSHATSFRAYQNYGDVVLFDTTYKLNMYDMPVGVWVGVSNFGSSCFFGCCMLRDERTTSFVWACQAFLKQMNGKAPESVLTDQDLAMKDAIRQVFPQSYHALCLWHIAKKFPTHLRPILKQRYNEWKDIFWEFTRVETIEDFELRWQAMVDRFGLQSNPHIADLYAERRRWAAPYIRQHFFAGMTTTGRSEAMNASLKRFIKRQVNLTEFMRQVVSAVGMMDYNGEMMLTKDKVQNICTKTHLPLERHAAAYLTPYAFAKFQEQILSSFSYAAYITDVSEGKWLVRHMEKVSGGRVVHFTTSENLKCSCELFEFEGILCRHAVSVLVRCNVFETPKGYIKFRWTRQASVRLPPIQSSVEDDRQKKELLQGHFHRLCGLAGKSYTNLLLVEQCISSLIHQLQGADQDPLNNDTDTSHTNPQWRSMTYPATLSGSTAAQPIQTPPCSNTKGRKRHRRSKSFLEVTQRRRMCRAPGCGRFDHDRRNCPLLNPDNWEEPTTQSSVPNYNENHGGLEESNTISGDSESEYGQL